MLRRLGQQFRKSKQNKGKSEEKQPTTSQPTFAALLSSFLKRAVTGAEQIADSIKTKAQTEAKEEAGRIIGQARQEAEEIKRKAEIAARQGTTAPESVEATPLREEVAEEVTEQPVQVQAEVAEEEVEQPAQLQAEVTEEEVKQPVQVPAETAVSEPVAVTAGELSEQHIREKKPAGNAAGMASLKRDSQTIYTGEVELAISVPVDLKMVSKLYNYLQTIPEIKIIHTTGTWDRGTTITVGLDKPMPLISIISKIGGIEAIPELSEKDSPGKEKLGSLLGRKRGRARRIRLTPTN